MGEKWRLFKAELGQNYIFNEKTREIAPFEQYVFDKETWKLFVQSRHEPQFQVSWVYFPYLSILSLLLKLMVCYFSRRKEKRHKRSSQRMSTLIDCLVEAMTCLSIT